MEEAVWMEGGMEEQMEVALEAEPVGAMVEDDRVEEAKEVVRAVATEAMLVVVMEGEERARAMAVQVTVAAKAATPGEATVGVVMAVKSAANGEGVAMVEEAEAEQLEEELGAHLEERVTVGAAVATSVGSELRHKWHWRSVQK